jgi:hypothetical protein
VIQQFKLFKTPLQLNFKNENRMSKYFRVQCDGLLHEDPISVYKDTKLARLIITSIIYKLAFFEKLILNLIILAEQTKRKIEFAIYDYLNS